MDNASSMNNNNWPGMAAESQPEGEVLGGAAIHAERYGYYNNPPAGEALGGDALDGQETMAAPKPYTFRKLNSTDLFPMIRIISKIGLDELTQVFEGNVVNSLIDKTKEKVKSGQGQAESEQGQEESGQRQQDQEWIVGIGIILKLANKILEHIPCCEKEIYTLLGSVSGMGAEAVKALDLEIFLQMINDFIMKEEFKSFFSVASKYIKQLK